MMLELLAPPEKNPKVEKNRNHSRIERERCFLTVLPKPEKSPDTIEMSNRINNRTDKGKKYSLNEGTFRNWKYSLVASKKYHWLKLLRYDMHS